MLMAVVESEFPFPELNLDHVKVINSVIAYCGGPDMVLQLHQMLCNKARIHCKKQIGFKGLIRSHPNDLNGSV